MDEEEEKQGAEGAWGRFSVSGPSLLMPQVIGNLKAEGTGAPNLSRIGDINKTPDLPLCLTVLEQQSRRVPEGDKCFLNVKGHY